MIRGLYTSGWSMMAINKQMDTITNNLANANTNGFKKDIAVFESFPDMLTRRINDIRSASAPGGNIGDMTLGQDVAEVFTEYIQGGTLKTDALTDLSIKDSGTAFFAVRVPGENGGADQEMYTRDGAFIIDSLNRLSTKDGYPVLGRNGIITVQNEAFTVQPDGTIVQNGQVVDTLQIRDFNNPETLRKYGNNLVQTTPETAERPFRGEVLQGYLEESNVNVIKEMVNMITAMRAYEANQKVLRTHDETLQKAVNEIGAVK